MKKFTLLILATLLFVFAHSQTKPHFIAINIGASIPLGVFGKVDGNDEDGYAQTGFNFALEGAGFMSKTVGIGAYIGGNAHNIDEYEFLKSFRITPDVTNATMTSDPYTISNFMAGLFINLEATEIISFRFKLLAGSFAAKMPEMTISVTDGYHDTYVINFPEASDSRFTGMLGASALFNLSKRIGLAANFEYTGATCDFIYIIDTESVLIEQKFSIFNITAGLNIMLGSKK